MVLTPLEIFFQTFPIFLSLVKHFVEYGGAKFVMIGNFHLLFSTTTWIEHLTLSELLDQQRVRWVVGICISGNNEVHTSWRKAWNWHSTIVPSKRRNPYAAIGVCSSWRELRFLEDFQISSGLTFHRDMLFFLANLWIQNSERDSLYCWRITLSSRMHIEWTIFRVISPWRRFHPFFRFFIPFILHMISDFFLRVSPSSFSPGWVTWGSCSMIRFRCVVNISAKTFPAKSSTPSDLAQTRNQQIRKIVY